MACCVCARALCAWLTGHGGGVVGEPLDAEAEAERADVGLLRHGLGAPLAVL